MRSECSVRNGSCTGPTRRPFRAAIGPTCCRRRPRCSIASGSRRITGPPVTIFHGDFTTCHAFCRLDHFPDRVTVADSHVVVLRLLGVQFFDCQQMGSAEIIDMDIISDAGSIRSIVIGAEDGKRVAPSRCGLKHQRNQVCLGIVIFAQTSVFGTAGNVEVTQSREGKFRICGSLVF